MRIIWISILLIVFSCGKEVVPENACVDSSPENCDCFKATNKERVNANLPTMAYCKQCYLMAQAHADDMAANNFFSHDRPAVGGKPAETFAERASRYGLGFGAGENIASGVTGAQAVTLWMNSPGHKANILNPMFKSFACGTKSGYSVQVFSVTPE